MAQTLKDEVRQAILEAAMEAMLEKGTCDINMREIGRAAGITAGNVYRYFENKDELIRAITAPMTDRINQIIREESGNLVDMTRMRLEIPPDFKPSQDMGPSLRLILELIGRILSRIMELCRSEPRRFKILLNARVVGDKLRECFAAIVKESILRLLEMDRQTWIAFERLTDICCVSLCAGVERQFRYILDDPMEYDQKVMYDFVFAQVYAAGNYISAATAEGRIRWKREGADGKNGQA